MKKKVFVTRRLLKENEEKLKELFEVSLNKEDKIYNPQEIIDGSKNYDGILSSVSDPINADTISKFSSSIKEPSRFLKVLSILSLILLKISG